MAMDRVTVPGWVFKVASDEEIGRVARAIHDWKVREGIK